MGWLSTLREAHGLNVHKGEAEQAAFQMYGNGQVAEDVTGDSTIIDELNGEPYGTTLSDQMERRGMVTGSMRDVLRSPEQLEERLDRMDAAEEAKLDRELADEIAAENAEWERDHHLDTTRQRAEGMAADWNPPEQERIHTPRLTNHIGSRNDHETAATADLCPKPDALTTDTPSHDVGGPSL